MRKLLAVGLLTGMLAALLTATPALSKRKSLEIDDNYFVREGDRPPTVTVHPNDTVVWEWEGTSPHDVTVKRGPVKFHSKIKTSGTFKKKLTEPGTYKIICTIHAPDMRMTLKVK